MELGLRLSQKQTLKLVMTPRLQQALKLLQMPSLELSQHIEQELLTNPLLELEEDTPESDPPEEQTETESSESEEAPSSDESDFDVDGDIDWNEYFDDGFEFQDGGRAEREETEFFERTPVGRATLTESLVGQLHLLELSDETMRIAEYLLGCLDESGFLVIPIDEVAEELGLEVDKVEVALRSIQELEPSGVGARDLTESLLIQLRQLDREDSLAFRIVRDHFEAFKQKQFQEIARALKVQPADIQEAVHDIATLNPRPGAQLALEDARYIVPDLVVQKIEGVFVASLNDGTVPRLRVSRNYRDILRRDAAAPKKGGEADAGTNSKEAPAANSEGPAAGTSDPASDRPPAGRPNDPASDGAGPSSDAAPVSERERVRDEEVKFVQSKLRSANWLIQTIEQRRRTMIKVMEAIVEAQYAFFESGPEALRPLTLQDVAERIGMPESTVSRVTTNKYVQTPRGVFPLKHFFSSRLGTESGQSVSSKMAMARIRELIEKESKKKPLSDQKIAELLRREGLIVARRTVAKYREKMEILPARYRKEF